jgi:hypothetical protein
MNSDLPLDRSTIFLSGFALKRLIKENASGPDAYSRHVDESAQVDNWILKQFDILVSKFQLVNTAG